MAENKTKAREASVPAGVSSRKGGISVYLVASFPGQGELLANLGKHEMGGGCLHTRKLSDVDLRVLEKLVVGTVAEKSVSVARTGAAPGKTFKRLAQPLLCCDWSAAWCRRQADQNEVIVDPQNIFLRSPNPALGGGGCAAKPRPRIPGP